MNREIKFRGYLKDSYFKGHEEHPSYEPLLNNRIVKIHSIHFNSKKVIISRPTGGNTSVEFKDIEIMPFTGLYDKNSVPIYEGDIINNKNIWEDVNYEVIYDKGAFYGKRKNLYFKENVYLKLYKVDKENIEVIGNIYTIKENR